MNFTLKGEPVPKGRPRMNRRTGNVYTPSATVSFETKMAWAARSTRQSFGTRGVIVSTDFYCRSKTLDGDNCHKSVLDSLQLAGVYDNDKQVVEGHYRVFRGAKEPRTEVRVYPVDNLTLSDE